MTLAIGYFVLDLACVARSVRGRVLYKAAGSVILEFAFELTALRPADAAASRLGAGRLLFPIGWRENFGYKSLQRCGSGVPWGAWLERL